MNNILTSKLFDKISLSEDSFYLCRNDSVYTTEINRSDIYYKNLFDLTLFLNGKYQVIPFFQNNADNQRNLIRTNNVVLYWKIDDNLITKAKYIVYRIDYTLSDKIFNFVKNLFYLDNFNIYETEPDFCSIYTLSSELNNDKVSVIESLIYVALPVDLIITLILTNNKIKRYIYTNYKDIVCNLIQRKIYAANFVFKLNKINIFHQLYLANIDTFLSIATESQYTKFIKSKSFNDKIVPNYKFIMVNDIYV